jgi:HPt (histidine-containing phosphotransfer) domain-containing protein
MSSQLIPDKMTTNDTEKICTKVCNLNYLDEMMGGKKKLIKEIIDVFLVQIPEELAAIKNGILKNDYELIRNFSHTMKSSVSIMGITLLNPVLQEMEVLATEHGDIEKIRELDMRLNAICELVIEEIEKEKIKYF